MARKSELENLSTLLINSSWWISPIVGLAAWLGLTVGVRHLFGAHPLMRGVIDLLGNLAPFVFGFFCLLGVVAFFNAKRKGRLVDEQSSYATLRQLSWREFEEMVAEAFRRRGYRVVENHKGGADGGVDVRLIKEGQRTVVQCKNWKANKVSVKVVREIYGVMVAEGAQQAIVICSGMFTKDAWAFAQGKPIDLIGGKKLLELLATVQTGRPAPTVPASPAPSLTATGTTPIAPPAQKTGPAPERKACPACGEPMTLRKTTKGPRTGQVFWGCTGFPKCRTALPR